MNTDTLHMPKLSPKWCFLDCKYYLQNSIEFIKKKKKKNSVIIIHNLIFVRFIALKISKSFKPDVCKPHNHIFPSLVCLQLLQQTVSTE